MPRYTQMRFRWGTFPMRSSLIWSFGGMSDLKDHMRRSLLSYRMTSGVLLRTARLWIRLVDLPPRCSAVRLGNLSTPPQTLHQETTVRMLDQKETPSETSPLS